MKLEESYARLLGRPPSEDERRNLYRVRDALDLRDNDALFVVLMALQHYQTLYESIPAQIAKASEDAVRRPNRITRKAVAAIAAAVLYTGAYAIHSREDGYAAGYEAGHKSARTTSYVEPPLCPAVPSRKTSAPPGTTQRSASAYSPQKARGKSRAGQ